MELRSIIRPPKRFGVDNEPAANVLRSTGPKPHSKPFNPNLPPAPFPSWDPNEDHGISSAHHPDEGHHVQTRKSIDNFTQTTLSFNAGVTGSSAQRFMRQMPGTDGIYISTPRDILTFIRLMDEWVRTKDSEERQSNSCSDNSIQAGTYYNDANQTETRPVNENGILISELANEFKLLHPTFRSTIIRAVIEREGISEDDIEQELVTPLPYWLGIDENSVKCVLHDYMVMSREPTFEGPNDHDLTEAVSFLHRASLPLPLLYPWTDSEANLHNAGDLDNGYAIDKGAASNVGITFDYGDPLNNEYVYGEPNITTFEGGYQCSSSLQPVIDLQDPTFMSDQSCFNEYLSQPEDLSAQSGLYSEDFINNIKTDETAYSYLPTEYNAPAALAVDQSYSSTFLPASDFAMPVSSPVKLHLKSEHCSPIPPFSNSWADNSVPMQGMSVPSCMSNGQYGDVYGHQYNHGFCYNNNYNYDVSSTAAGPSSVSADSSFATSAFTSTASTINKNTQFKCKGKGKAKVSDATNTLDDSNIKSTGDVRYAGLPHSFTYNSLESTTPSPAQPITGTAHAGPSAQPEPPKRKRGRPKKEVSVVVDKNGTASVRTSGGGSSRSGPGRGGTKTKKAKKAANNQQMAASGDSSRTGEGFTDMSFVKRN